MGIEDYLLESKVIPKNAIFSDIMERVKLVCSKKEPFWTKITYSINYPTITLVVPPTVKSARITKDFSKLFSKTYSRVHKKNVYLTFIELQLKSNSVYLTYSLF